MKTLDRLADELAIGNEQKRIVYVVNRDAERAQAWLQLLYPGAPSIVTDPGRFIEKLRERELAALDAALHELWRSTK